MPHNLRRPPKALKDVSILLSEGSSLSSRQTISALGLYGYRVDVCDPEPFCIGRFSRFVRRFYRCPPWTDDPMGYLDWVVSRLDAERYDVLLPVHEQAYLFAAARERLGPKVGLALTPFGGFALLQSKTLFMRLVARLGLPHPTTRYVNSCSQVEAIADYPYYIKTPYGTAGYGVWKISNRNDRSAAAFALEEEASSTARPRFWSRRLPRVS